MKVGNENILHIEIQKDIIKVFNIEIFRYKIWVKQTHLIFDITVVYFLISWDKKLQTIFVFRFVTYSG